MPRGPVKGRTGCAVFLDRDGTLVEEVGYAASLDELVLYPWTEQCLRDLRGAGYLLIVVSNQAGVAKGLVDPAFPEIAFRHLQRRLTAGEAEPLLDAGYHCPHHPQGSRPEFTMSCHCRKPEPGMLEQAARDFEIDLRSSFVAGDHLSDIELAHRVGARAVLLRTGHGQDEVAKLASATPSQIPDHIADDLRGAVRWILECAGATVAGDAPRTPTASRE